MPLAWLLGEDDDRSTPRSGVLDPAMSPRRRAKLEAEEADRLERLGARIHDG